MASKLRVDSILPVDGAPTSGGGGIIQVVSSTINNQPSLDNAVNTSDWTGHGLSVTITPKFSTSKIHITGYMSLGFATSENIFCKLFKGGSVLTGAIGDQLGSGRSRATSATYFKGDEWATITLPINYLDTAGSTSALTYAIALNISTSSTGKTLYVNRPASSTDNASYPTLISTITAMEVSA